MARQNEDRNAEAEVLRTLVDQATYGRARLSAGSLAIRAEREPRDGRGAEPILLEVVSCSASGRGVSSRPVVSIRTIVTARKRGIVLSADWR